MEVIAETEYQDVYQIKYGVSIVVNKFKPMEVKGILFPMCYTNKSNSEWYAEGCEEDLRILTREYYVDKIGNVPAWSLPAGTVVYKGVPVTLTGKDKWEYKLKIRRSDFTGSYEEMRELLAGLEDVLTMPVKKGVKGLPVCPMVSGDRVPRCMMLKEREYCSATYQCKNR